MAGQALIPRFGWLKQLGGGTILKDVIAGLILSILLVPQAMAYAQLAGLPPETGLFAALLPPILYAFFGTSAFVSVGPVALVSLVIGEAASGAGIEPIQAAAIVAIQAGALLALLGAVNLGRIVNFVSEPVLLGFTAAAAFLIAFSQLPTLLGIETDRAGELPTAVAGLIENFGALETNTAIIGIAALVAFLLIGRYGAPLLWKLGVRPPLRQAIAKSMPLLVIVIASIVAVSMGAVETVEAPEAGLPSIVLPSEGADAWLALLPSSIAVAIIVFVTATAVAKSLAGTDRRHLDSSREAVALGLSNIFAPLVGGYAVGASLSRSALVEDSGARTPLASIVAASVVLAVILLLAPILAYLPKTALAALVISAVFGLIKLRDMRDTWAHDRIEGLVIAVTFLATLLLGVQWGLAVGAIAGLANFLWFSSLPRVTRLGSDDGGETYRSVDRDAVRIETLPVLPIRIDRSVFFANAAHVEDSVFRLIGKHDDVNCVVLDMRTVNSVDASGVAMLRRLVERLYDMDMAVHIAEAHEPVQRQLDKLDSRKCIFHRTMQDAVQSCGVETEPQIAPT